MTYAAEHATGLHGFLDYGHFYYRIRPQFDINIAKRTKVTKGWFGRQLSGPRDLIEQHAAMSTSPLADTTLRKLSDEKSQ